MYLDEAIWTHFSAIAEFIALVPATRIHWIDAPQGTAIPLMVYRCISSPPLYDSTDKWERIEFVVVAADKIQCQNIGKLVDDHLDHFTGSRDGLFGGMAIDYITKIGEFDPALREDGNYEQIKEYRFVYH